MATITMTETSTFNSQAILDLDPWLKDFLPAIEARHGVFKQWKDTIIRSEKGYDEFSKGYLKFGFNIEKGGTIVYREWAPNAIEASLIGDFSEYYRC